MATARIDIRLNDDLKVKAEKASALLGTKSLTEYIVKLMDHDATKVLKQHESMTVKDDIFDAFMQACEQAKAPNKALLDAVEIAEKSGIR